MKNPTIENLLPSQKETYFRLLSTAAALSGDSIDKLLYLCRLSVGSACEFRALPLQKMAYQTDKLDWRAAASVLKDCQNPFLLDMLMVMGINGSANNRAIDFLAEIAALLECTEDDVITVSQLSTALLSNSFELFQAIQPEKPYPELNYPISPEWLERARKKCGSFQEPEVSKSSNKNDYRVTEHLMIGSMTSLMGLALGEHPEEVGEKIVSSGSYVKKGQKLVVFSYKYKISEELQKDFPPSSPMIAPCSGTVFYKKLSKEETAVYIESPFAPEKNI